MKKENKKHVSDLLPDYLDGLLTPEVQKQVEKYIAENEEGQKELEELKALYKAFEEDSISVPSDRLRAKFETMLNQEKGKQTKVVPLESKSKKWTSNFLKVAASIALLIASFQTGRITQMEKSNQDVAALLEQSLKNKQTAMLSLMENQSASKRIQGVSYITEFPDPDEAILNALANRLLLDENDIVRLNAYEALAKHTTSEFVKEVFVKALNKEKNPSIQIGIIQSLVKIQEKKAVAPMQKLLEQEDTQPFVKNEIETALPKII